MKSTYSLLLVDDEPANLELLNRIFRQEYKVYIANDGQGALGMIESHSIDALITDYRMPGMSGIELLEAVRRKRPDIVRIVLTGYTEPDEVIAAINRGEAHRYITKPFQAAELSLTLKQALESNRLQRERQGLLLALQQQNETLQKTEIELRKLNQELENRVTLRTQELEESNKKLQDALIHVTELARTDPLTQLWNRRYFYELATREIEISKRFKHPLTLLMIDIDKFKAINDMLGHKHGDEVLTRLAFFLQDSIRKVDICGRYGGDEFVMCLTQTDLDGAKLVAARLLATVRNSSFLPNYLGVGAITLSIGMSCYQGEEKSFDTLITEADVALYTAKTAGRDRFSIKALTHQPATNSIGSLA